MKRPQLQFNLLDPLLIDTFAGGHSSPGSSMKEPVHTVTGKGHQSVVAVHVDRTLTSGKQQAVVTSHLEKLYTSARRGVPTDAPMPTVTNGGQHIAEVRAFLVKYYGCVRESGQSLEEPMHTIRSKACMGLVTVEGEDYVITDIGMRMLEPRELFNAQGFPPDYEIEHVVIDGVRKRCRNTRRSACAEIQFRRSCPRR